MVYNPADVGTRGDTEHTGEVDNLTSIYSYIKAIYDEVFDINSNLHNSEYWLGAAAVPNGEIHVADLVGASISPFALLSGNDDWGNWVQVLGSSDSPIKTDSEEIDAHRVMGTTTDSTSPFFVQFVIGESADIAAKIAAKQYTEFGYIAATNANDAGITNILTFDMDVGTKVWARCICIGQNAKTINFYVGVHEHDF